MEDKLKDLKEKMNSTLLKDLAFNEKRKRNVLTQIKEEDPQLTRFTLSRTWKFTLSTVLFTSLVAGISLFAVNELQPSKSGELIVVKDKATTSPSNPKYVPDQKKEHYGPMTKEEILTKMINTIDYFETAKGSFEEFTGSDKTTVEYELNMKEPIGGYGKTTHIPNGKYESQVSIDYYDKSTIWSISKDTNTYRKSGYYPTATCCTLTIDNAFSVDSEGIDMTSYRDRPPIGIAQNSLFPYEIASNYTREIDSWDIEKQDEMIKGHNTIVIKGQLDGYASEKRKSKTFRFWVDKDTGILVQYETYNDLGEVVNYLHTRELLINVPVDPTRLKPDLTGYKDQMILKKEQPTMRSGVAESDVPEEIKVKWKLGMEKANETTVLQFDGKWYIIPEKGYIVDTIETEGTQGTLFLGKASPEKSKYVFPIIAEGYNVAVLNVKK